MQTLANSGGRYIVGMAARHAAEQEDVMAIEYKRILALLTAPNEDEAKQEIQEIMGIQAQTPQQIVNDEQTMEQLMNQNEFEDKVKARYIKRDVQTILNDAQLKQSIVSINALTALQNQINTANNQRQQLNNTINELNNQIRQLQDQMRDKEAQINRQINEQKALNAQINAKLINPNVVPDAKKDTVINNIQGARMDLPTRSRLNLKGYKNWIIQYEAKTKTTIELAAESDL